LTVGDATVYGLLDSGAEITLIPTENSKGMLLEPDTRNVFAANGTDICIRFCAYADGTPLQITGLVSDHVSDIILGLDFLCAQAAVWNFDRGTVNIGDIEHKLHARAARKWCRRVVLGDEVVLPPSSESIIFTNVKYQGRIDCTGDGQWATAPCQISSGISVARALVPSRAVDIPVRVFNNNAQPVRLATGTVVAELDQVDVCGVVVDGAT